MQKSQNNGENVIMEPERATVDRTGGAEGIPLFHPPKKFKCNVVEEFKG